MTQSHYSLRWNNHQNHILAAFEALLQAETLVDVTLVCGDTSVRCHKVVLSACSPFFQRIFSENPCKHPVIVLKDFNGWEIQAIVEFMYKGEISVVQEQLQSLIKAAESLQIRGLANQDPFGINDKETNSIVNRTPTPTASPNDYDRPYYHHPPLPPPPPPPSTGGRGCYPTPGITMRTPNERISPFSPMSCPTNYEPAVKLPHMSRLSFPETLLPPPPPPLPTTRSECQSPIPRRKQARPRRRSGEMCNNNHHHNNNSNNNNNGPQDLSSKSSSTPPLLQHHHHHHQQHQQQQQEDIAENLCMKKTKDDRMSRIDEEPKNLQTTGSTTITTTTTTTTGSLSTSSSSSSSSCLTPVSTPTNLLPPLPPPPGTSIRTTPDPVGSPEMDLSMASVLGGSVGGGGGGNKDYRTSPPVSLPPTLNMKQEIDNHSPLPFPPMPSVSALAMTPPHSKFFGLDSPLGLFPPGLDVRNPLFDMTDPRNTPESPLFSKKKMGRPKGQHSAPRGGPPRSWTNAELTEALQHVWNKKMTTSQASRIFGIPYNSLLMYVRGKYGKSLKLEQLRKDCIAGPNPPPIDLLNMSGNNNNNNNSLKNDRNNSTNDLLNEQLQSNTRPSSTEDPHHQQQQQQPPPPVFNPFAHSFYPDFGTGFPIPVSMIHLLPQSEKSRDHHYGQPLPSHNAHDLDDNCHGNQKERVKREMDDEQDLFRPPSQTIDDRRELVQQNGQD